MRALGVSCVRGGQTQWNESSMKISRLIVLATAALLAGVAAPAIALDIGGTSVTSGSSSNGGTTVSAGNGDTSASVTLGGGSTLQTSALARVAPASMRALATRQVIS